MTVLPAHNSIAMAQIGQYTVLPITIPAVAANLKPTTHTIYLRPHAPKIPTEGDARSLFLANIPIDSTSAHLRAVFTSLIGPGRFESVSFEHEKKSVAAPTSAPSKDKQSSKKRKRDEGTEADVELPQIWDRVLHKSGGIAVVRFVDRKGVEGVLKSVRKLGKKGKGWPIWGEGLKSEGLGAVGSERYKTHQQLRFPDEEELKRGVDAFMENFNRKEEEEREGGKRKRNEPDEDGFVTVGRGGRVGPARREEVERKRVEMEEKEKKAREEREKGGFYRFQMREKRKAEQAELVKKFEEDKKRVEKMRGERKGRFRPEN